MSAAEQTVGTVAAPTATAVAARAVASHMDPSIPAAVAPPSLPSTLAARPATALQGRATSLERVRSAAGQVVPLVQYQIARLGPAGQAGLAALTAAVAVALGVLIPAYHNLQTLGADIASAQHPAAGASLEQAAPHLVATLPTREQIPAVLAKMFAAAAAAGVPLDAGRYAFTPAKSGTVARYDVEFPVKAAGYPQVRAFVNGTLTAVPAASLDKLHIERKAIGDQTVSADIGFVVWVRSGDAP